MGIISIIFSILNLSVFIDDFKVIIYFSSKKFTYQTEKKHTAVILKLTLKIITCFTLLFVGIAYVIFYYNQWLFWQSKIKFTSFVYFSINPNATTMLFHSFFTNCKPNAIAGVSYRCMQF